MEINWPNVALVAVFAAIGFVVYLARRKQQDRYVRLSFARLQFETPFGTVDGTAMRVIKVERMAIGPNVVYGGGNQARDEFWYCVGAGPSYFLAIATISTSRYINRVDVQWVVRPLSAERMRGALAGDRKALKLAFG
jgi:hypothetical protein